MTNATFILEMDGPCAVVPYLLCKCICAGPATSLLKKRLESKIENITNVSLNVISAYCLL